MEANKAAEAPKYEALGIPRVCVAVATIAVSLWYMWWRLQTINHDAPIFSWALYIAECFGIFTLSLHLFMVSRLTVREAPLPDAGHTVDVFIPTYNESLDIVRRTVVKSISMEYPHKTYLLDDSTRPEMRTLAEELGCYYIARTTNEHAKAGNLNNALANSNGEFIAFFDADHAPKSTFLVRTLGYFNNPKVAFVQTPQDFYNLDSYQHRVSRTTGRVWTEQSLFFRIIQRGKDYWDAAFFCGSCAIMRRSAIEAIGGIATGTITEDIHTSIRLHKYGFSSVYHAESLAFGIAPAHVEPFIQQRIRWGQGAMQVWRKEGVLFNRHLTFAQKLNYIASMSIYFDGWQKFLYYITPVIVLLTGVMPLITTMDQFMIHFVPFFVMSLWCFEELGRGYSEMLFVEQYNMARFGAFCYATLGLFMDNLKFKVTTKDLTGGTTNYIYLLPQYAILVFNAIAIPAGVILYNQYGHLNLFSLSANLIWATVNLILAAMVLMFSLRRGTFQRANYRFAIPLVARLNDNGKEIYASVDDLSTAGMLMMVPGEMQLKKDDHIAATLYLPDGPLSIEAVVKALHGNARDITHTQGVGCELIWNDNASRERMERFLYGSDLEWHLYNFSEMNWTLLAGVSGKEQARHEPLPSWKRTKTSTISSMMLTHADDTVTTGIISLDPKTKRGTLMTFKPLPENSPVETSMLTHQGWKVMNTKVANQNKADSSLSNVYLYQLESVPA
jgi:cellulose synthase (UDP-forming)